MKGMRGRQKRAVQWYEGRRKREERGAKRERKRRGKGKRKIEVDKREV